VSLREFAGPEQFQAAAKRRYREEEIPGKGWHRFRNLTEREQSQWETANLGTDGKRTTDGMQETKAHLIVLTLVNEEGDLRFHESQIDLVMGADSAYTNAVFEVAREHCGIPTKDVTAVAALRALQKNSDSGHGSPSHIGSPGSVAA